MWQCASTRPGTIQPPVCTVVTSAAVGRSTTSRPLRWSSCCSPPGNTVPTSLNTSDPVATVIRRPYPGPAYPCELPPGVQVGVVVSLPAQGDPVGVSVGLGVGVGVGV